MKALLSVMLFFPLATFAWKNGQDDNALTNKSGECSDPPYSTHDWIADRALALLPEVERAWLEPYKALYFIGTEAPDSNDIHASCGGPHSGYDDRLKGHSVDWNSRFSDFAVHNGRKKDRSARRAREEYDKATKAYDSGNLSAASFYLGAMAHYMGDAAQYGHSYRGEKHHGDYEGWVGRRTKAFNSGNFDSFIKLDKLIIRWPYTAVKRTSKVVAKGNNDGILPAIKMDALYGQKKTHQEYWNSIGRSLNYGINELADVLHTFYIRTRLTGLREK